MKHVDKHIRIPRHPHALGESQKSSQSSQRVTNGESEGEGEGEIPLLSPRVVAVIFQTFLLRYGHRWRGVVEGLEEAAGREWARGLAGLSESEIRRGLDAWQGAWPPSLPEFRRACEGADAPPEAAEAWDIVCHARGAAGTARERYKHSAVLAAVVDPRIANRIHNLFLLPAASALPAWRQVYEEYVARWRQGERWKWPKEDQNVRRLPDQAAGRGGWRRTEKSRQIAAQAIREMRAALRGGGGNEKREG